MPRSRSSSLESIMRSTWVSFERNVPLCCSMASTRVVLPWSTCAMMAILRMLELKIEQSFSEESAREDLRVPLLLLYYAERVPPRRFGVCVPLSVNTEWTEWKDEPRMSDFLASERPDRAPPWSPRNGGGLRWFWCYPPAS